MRVSCNFKLGTEAEIDVVCKIDWDDLATNLLKLETDCRTSWDHLHTLEKHDSAMVSKNRYGQHSSWLQYVLLYRLDKGKVKAL